MGNRRESLGRNRKMSSPMNTNFGFVFLLIVFGVGTWQAAKWFMQPEHVFGAKELKCPFYKITFVDAVNITMIRGCGRTIVAQCDEKRCSEHNNDHMATDTVF